MKWNIAASIAQVHLPWYRHLYVQVLAAILLGALLGRVPLDEGTASLGMPAGAGRPGWKAKDGGTVDVLPALGHVALVLTYGINWVHALFHGHVFVLGVGEARVFEGELGEVDALQLALAAVAGATTTNGPEAARSRRTASARRAGNPASTTRRRRCTNTE